MFNKTVYYLLIPTFYDDNLDSAIDEIFEGLDLKFYIVRVNDDKKLYDDDDLNRPIHEIFKQLELMFYIVQEDDDDDDDDDSIIEGDLNNYGRGYEHSGW